MTVEVIAVGGYEEVGKNMTAVKIGEDVIIFDMGIHLDRISIHEDTDIDRMHSLDLIERGVIPDDTLMKDVGYCILTRTLGPYRCCSKACTQIQRTYHRNSIHNRID